MELGKFSLIACLIYVVFELEVTNLKNAEALQNRRRPTDKC